MSRSKATVAFLVSILVAALAGAMAGSLGETFPTNEVRCLALPRPPLSQLPCPCQPLTFVQLPLPGGGNEEVELLWVRNEVEAILQPRKLDLTSCH